MTLTKKLNEIKFPNKVPNSPYSVKATIPATPITMMMELKNWQRTNIFQVQMVEEYKVS